MEQQGQNGRREMYILSLDNNRIFWILSIALLVLVFLFLLGYWIGHDNTVPASGNYQAGSAGGDNTRLNSLRRMLDDRSLGGGAPAAAPAAGGVASGKTAAGSSDGKSADDGVKKPAVPGLRTDGLTKQEKREFDSLKNGDNAKQPVSDRVKTRSTSRKKTVSRKVRRTRRVARRKTTVRRSSVYSSGGRYSIQVASLASAGSASRLRSQLAGRSYRAYVSRTTINGKRYYRIKVGRFTSYSKARRILARLKRTGYGRGSYIVSN